MNPYLEPPTSAEEADCDPNPCTCHVPWPVWVDGDPVVECRSCYGVCGVPSDEVAA